MNKRTRLWVFFIIIVLTVFVFALYVKIRMSMGNSILGPVGVGSLEIMKRRQEQGKMIRIYFKDSVTDDQALSLMNEWKQLPNVNGSSFRSAEMFGRTVVDLFVIEVDQKPAIIQQIQQNVFVDRIIDSKE